MRTRSSGDWVQWGYGLSVAWGTLDVEEGPWDS